MEHTIESLRISPKLKHILTRAYGLQRVGENAICAEMNGWLRYFLAHRSDDMDNIFSLVWKSIKEMNERGYDEKRINDYTLYGFAPILFYCTTHNTLKYDIESLNSFMSDTRELVQSHKFGYQMLNGLIKAVRLLQAYHDEGVLPQAPSPYRVPRKISGAFEELLRVYDARREEFRVIAPNSLKREHYVVNTFLWYMEKYGVTTLDGFSHKAINDCFTQLSPNYVDGGKHIARAVRHFLAFLFQIELTPIDYSVAIPQSFPSRRKLRFGFTSEEIPAILDNVNRSTRIGKRDYVIMLIAARTGLRACDIAALKLKDIDWHGKEIRIVQQKTGVAHTLPLTAEVGNAIVDYFYEARIKRDSEYMFPLSANPTQHIKSPTISALTTKYMKTAGIDESLPYRGVHSFRRSFGKRLLDASLTPDTLMEMLGQVNLNSITPYTAIYEDGLKRCALPLSSIIMEAV